MKKFLTSYAFLAIAFFLIQCAVAFWIGTRTIDRYVPSAGFAPENLPATPAEGGFQAMAAVAVINVVGFGLRFLAYWRLDRKGITSRTVWWAIVVAETLFAALTLWITWTSNEPVEGAGLGGIVNYGLLWLGGTVVSVILLAAVFVRRREPAPTVPEQASASVPD